MSPSDSDRAGSDFRHALSRKNIRWVVTAAVLLEWALLTFARGVPGRHLSPLFLLAASLLSGIALLALSRDYTLPAPALSRPSPKKFLLWLLPLLLLLIMAMRYHAVIHSVPLAMDDASRSDIIPQVMVLVQRFINGTFPYLPINIWGYTLNPTYLPLQWLPFVIPEWLGLDYRWMSFAVYFFAIFLLLRQARIYFRRDLHFMIFSLVPFLFSALYLFYDPVLFAVTIESLIAGYYLLFALSLFSLRVLPAAGGLLLTLLSRFSIVLWTPFYFLALFFSPLQSRALRIAFILLAGIIIIYVLPFLSQDSSIFLNGYRYHSLAALAEWTPRIADAQPWHLYRGYGLALFFYEYVPGSLVHKLHLLQRIHLLMSLLAVVLPAFLFYRQRKHYDLRLFLIGSLKIYLAVFYAFIQIPYHYLYIVPAILTLPILLIVYLPLPRRMADLV